MSQLLGLSFDCVSSPSIELKAVHRPGGHAPYGWGFGWYPGEDHAAMLVKDPTSIGDNAMTEVLRDWKRFRSTAFVCHLRGAAQRITQQDTHPFLRSYGGRDWLLAHNGDLRGDAIRLGDEPVFSPVGRTDSERAFCWLLARVREVRARCLADLGWARLHAWLSELNALGTLNLLLSDGRDVVAYHDRGGFNGLAWARRRPPHETAELDADDLRLAFPDGRDTTRTMVVFATRPLSREPVWAPFLPGQLLVARRGAVVWSSHGEVDQPVARPGAGEGGATASGPVQVQASAAAAGPLALEAGPAPGGPTVGPPGGAPEPVVAGRPGAAAREYALGAGPVPPGAAPEPVASGRGPSLAPAPRPEPAPAAPTLGRRRYAVFHRTVYRYATPVEQSTHLYRLRPVHDLGQTVHDYRFEIAPAGSRRDFEDVFGNQATRVKLERPYDELAIVVRSIVEVSSDLDLHQAPRRDVIPLVWMPWQRQMMNPYLLPPELPETQLRELSDYAMSFVERQDYDLFETLADLNRTIYRDYAYTSGSTTLETTPFDVYVARRGVCQDFANLFICLARLLGIPARYRVGYIFTGGNYENKIQSDASHAWVELYLPWLGWRGYDPTNGCLVASDHVRVACGRNYRDATPSSGTIYAGGGGESLAVDVRVVPVGDDVRALEDLPPALAAWPPAPAGGQAPARAGPPATGAPQAPGGPGAAPPPPAP